MQGTVKWFSEEKGYGFITSENGEDHYFNVRSVQGVALPSNGDTVGFESSAGDKGLRANKVTIIEKAPTISNRSRDDRINCPECGRKIVPRMITYRGEPEKSVCPYCAATVKTFDDCFIATAVYRDGGSPEVRELRNFRDEKLLSNPCGRIFVSTYYRYSPQVAEWLKGSPRISNQVKKLLDMLVQHIKNRR